MRRRTPTIALAAVAATALLVSGCGRAADGPATANEEGQDVSDGPATGTVTVWAMGAEGEKLPELTKEFEAANPDVTVEVTAIPWDSAHDKFTTAITAGETPDAAMVGTTWMGEFAGLGALDPTPSTIDSGAFFEGAWSTTEVEGTSYGVPWYVETRLVYYRTDLAEQAGWTEPPADWEGLQADGRRHAVQGRRDLGHRPAGRRRGVMAERDAVRMVQRRRARHRGRYGLPVRQPADDRGRRVLPELLHRRDLRPRAHRPRPPPSPTSSAARCPCSSPGRG